MRSLGIQALEGARMKSFLRTGRAWDVENEVDGTVGRRISNAAVIRDICAALGIQQETFLQSTISRDLA